MKNLKSLSAKALISETQALVREELRIGLEVLAYLREIERRQLFLERGHSSLFVFCIRELNYSEPQAQLRIDAMRALRDTPEIEEKVRAGKLNVTTIAKVQRFLRKEKQRTGQIFPEQSRLELFEKVQGKSTREVESEFIKISPISALPQERERVLSEEKTELKLVIDTKFKQKLETLKALNSHRMKDVNSTSELLEILVEEALKKTVIHHGTNTKNTNTKTPATARGLPGKPDQNVAHISPKVKPHSRYIPLPTKRVVWTRDQGRCTYEDPKSKQRCESRRYLQMDHITPYSADGPSDDVNNLRLFCGAHNRYAWEKHQFV